MEAYVAFASSINGQLPLLIFLAAVMGLGKGGVPGFATIATALCVATAPLHIPSGLGYAVALQGPILTMIDVSAAWIHKEKIHWPSVWLLLPTSLLGMLVGQILAGFMTDAVARILVGFILLSILLLKVWKDVAKLVCPQLLRKRKRRTSKLVEVDLEKASVREEKSNGDDSSKEAYWGYIVGFFGGAATMLTNSMGPILNVYLLSIQRLSPSEYIGTRAMFFCFLNLGKTPMRFYAGVLGWPMIPLAVCLGFISILGVVCAKPIMLSMSEQTFVRLELMVIFIAGIKLFVQGVMAL